MAWLFPTLIGMLLNKHGNTLSNIFGSTVNKYTGAGLTGAEQEANQFTSEQSELANERDVFNYQHRYQWEVQDMQKAGLNPALLYGGSSGSGSVPSAPAGSSVSPIAGSDPISAIMDLALLKANIENIKADTRQKQAGAVGQEITNTNLDAQMKAAIQSTLATAEHTSMEALYKNLLIQYGLPEAEVNRVLKDIEVGSSNISRNEAESELARSSTALNEVRKKIDLDKLPYELQSISASARADRARALVDEFRSAYMRLNNTDVPNGAIASLIGMVSNVFHNLENDANSGSSGWDNLNTRTLFPFIDMLLSMFGK